MIPTVSCGGLTDEQGNAGFVDSPLRRVYNAISMEEAQEHPHQDGQSLGQETLDAEAKAVLGLGCFGSVFLACALGYSGLRVALFILHRLAEG